MFLPNICIIWLKNLWANSILSRPEPPKIQWISCSIESMNPCERIHESIKEESLMKQVEAWSCFLHESCLTSDSTLLSYTIYIYLLCPVCLTCFVSAKFAVYSSTTCWHLYFYIMYYNIYTVVFGSHTPNLCMQHGIMGLPFYRITIGVY